MTIAEVGLLFEANRPKVHNGLHEDDAERLERRREQLEAEGHEVI